MTHRSPAANDMAEQMHRLAVVLELNPDLPWPQIAAAAADALEEDE